jgi:hypothetical protein
MHDDEIVGRIYRMKVDPRALALDVSGIAGAYGRPKRRAPDSLAEAKAAFRAAWKRKTAQSLGPPLTGIVGRPLR